MNNWEIDEDLLREEKRLDELEWIKDFFLRYYEVPVEFFNAYTNYKKGDKYIIELKDDKMCEMHLIIDRKLYDIVDGYVTSHKIGEFEYVDVLEFVEGIDEYNE